MKKLPDYLSRSFYKYNIISRLILLEGGAANLVEKKKELINFLSQKGVNKNTARKWLTIERGAKLEIPFSVLVHIKDFFNLKYQHAAQNHFELISVEHLYFEDQLKVIADP